MAFLNKMAHVVSPEEIVKNPKKAPIPSRKNLDSMHATITSLEHYLREHPKAWEAGVIYATRNEMLAEFGVFLAGTVGQIVHNMDASDRMDAMGADSFAELMEQYGDVLGEWVQDGE
jgi:hypothetical protein